MFPQSLFYIEGNFMVYVHLKNDFLCSNRITYIPTVYSCLVKVGCSDRYDLQWCNEPKP